MNDKISVDKIAKGLLIPSLIVMLILSVQTSDNAVKALISIYIFMICLVGYIITEFWVNSSKGLINVNQTMSTFGKIMKYLTIIFVVLTIIGLVLNLLINYDDIVVGHMPNAYYNFSMLVNIFLSVQIMIILSNLLYNGGNLYTLTDKMTMISIFFGQLGFVMLAILISISLYSHTQG